MFGINTNYPQNSLASNNFTFLTDFFNRWTYFHIYPNISTANIEPRGYPRARAGRGRAPKSMSQARIDSEAAE